MNMLSKETSFQPAQPAQPAPAAPSILATRAMLADLSIRTWEPVKADKKAAKETEDSNGAVAGTARVTKTLITREALSAITTAASEARAAHYAMTCPWVFKGPSILSAMTHDKYMATMDSCRAKFEAARADFLPLYPSLRADAPARLGNLYNPADFPSESEIARAFTFEVKFYPIPTGADFRVDMAEGQAAAIRAQIEESAREGLLLAQRSIYKRILEPVAKLAEKLAAYQPGSKGVPAQNTFKDSLVENVKAMLATLPDLNFSGDPQIDAIAARLGALVTYEPEALRVSEPLRKDVQAQAAQIAAEVAQYMA